jgi:hypothetical protein
MKKRNSPLRFHEAGWCRARLDSLTTAGRLLQSLLSKRAADSADESCVVVEHSQAKLVAAGTSQHSSTRCSMELSQVLSHSYMSNCGSRR